MYFGFHLSLSLVAFNISFKQRKKKFRWLLLALEKFDKETMCTELWKRDSKLESLKLMLPKLQLKHQSKNNLHSYARFYFQLKTCLSYIPLSRSYAYTFPRKIHSKTLFFSSNKPIDGEKESEGNILST
jgi:hypothetical protein